MARILKEEKYSARRNDILDSAQRFIFSRGYDQMTIKDILDDLNISKGAFYHYFESKDALLEAFVERMVHEFQPLLVAIVYDPNLTALEKLQCYFDTGIHWKTARKTMMMELVRIWYADENALVRQKVLTTTNQLVSPLLTEIFHEGVREGIFNTSYPEYMYQINMNLMLGLGDAFSLKLLSGESSQEDLQELQHMIEAYNDALEKVLGLTKGSIRLMDSELLKEWLSQPEETENTLSEAQEDRDGYAALEKQGMQQGSLSV